MLLLPSFTLPNSRSLSGLPKLSTDDVELEFEFLWRLWICVGGEVGERRRAASWASISERMWKKCELDVGVRCSSSGRVSSLPSVNLDIRRGRVWIRRRGGEDAREGVWFAVAIFAVLVFG